MELYLEASLSFREAPTTAFPVIKESSHSKTGVESFQEDFRIYHDQLFEDVIWHLVNPWRRIGF